MARGRWIPNAPKPKHKLPPWTGRLVIGQGHSFDRSKTGRGWTDQCARITDQAAKNAGWRYAMERRVQILGYVPISPTSPTFDAQVRALVEGTDSYSVRIELNEEKGVCECTCPAFQSRPPCKHIFATAVIADQSPRVQRAANQWNAPARPEPPPWERRLRGIESKDQFSDDPAPLPAGFTFILDAAASSTAGHLVLRSVQPGRRPGELKPTPINASTLLSLEPFTQRLARLCLATPASRSSPVGLGLSEFAFPPGADALALQTLSACLEPVVLTSEGFKPLRLLPQTLQLVLKLSGGDETLKVGLSFAGVERTDRPSLFLASGIVVWPDGWCGTFPPVVCHTLVSNLAREGSMDLPRREMSRLVRLFAFDRQIQVEAEATTGVRLTDVLVPLEADVDLDDDTILIAPSDDFMDEHVDVADEGQAWVFDTRKNELARLRTPPLGPLIARLSSTGAKLVSHSSDGAILKVAKSDLAKAGAALAAEGIELRGYGQKIRFADSTRLNVTSGIDWFEVSGEAHFGDFRVDLQHLLEADENGAPLVTLADGSMGVLGADWDAFRSLSELGRRTGGKLRFSRPQAAILDLLLREHTVNGDETFEKLRHGLRRFDGIRPVEPPKEFQGELREYQKEGLSWMGFLSEFGFGGCLADDMGLGKTVQVLALLVARQKLDARPFKPTLLIVPKSVIFNWKAEASRFAPSLSFLDYTGAARPKGDLTSRKEDVWLTTYATMRQDIGVLKETAFSYVILDESQAIKNSASDTAKAVRLLRADYRLALSGTPIENHLGELKSLFDFLNPGLFGTSKEMPPALRSGGSALMARMVRPFLLRRTKAKVAPELPERIEQTIKVKLSAEERAVYDRVLHAARAEVLGAVEAKGLARSKIHVLTALLRLRQAACHSGLVDGKSTGPGSKVRELIDRLQQLKDEGNRALVFSQFTEFLAVVKRELPPELPHLYLDGKTRNREVLVNDFQDPGGPPVFLISLKAGGVGLNLTAAGYVFLLDPWWNPAVEAQAIDRAHRIGQKNTVIAYRLVAEDTIEEKILQLQERKKDLFKSIVAEDGSGDESLLRSLTREDLEAILS